MSTLPARNRVIYQSEALFVSPDTTGHHIYYESKFESDPDGCLVTGTDAAGDPIFFDACKGTASSDRTMPDDGSTSSYMYTTFDCNSGTDGNLVADKVLHPVLEAAGFSGTVNGNNQVIEHLKEKDFEKGSWGTSVRQLKRVQNANYSFTINRQDVNQFGQLGRIDSVVLEAPTVSLDYSYYLTDGYNERQLGFVTDGSTQALSGVMTRQQNDFGQNYFILTIPEGRDAIGGDTLIEEDNKTVIGLGNGYITDYSLEASVGSFPTASVTVEGLNIKSDKGTEWKTLPAVEPIDGTLICDRCYSLPPAISGEGTSVLKPGDIIINMKDSSLISKQISGTEPGYGEEDKGSAHIQSFSLSMPLGRTDLQRLGNTYAYAKEVDYPVTCTLTVNALVADLKEGNLVNLLCGKSYNMSVEIKNPQCIECGTNDNDNAFKIDFKSALLDSESFSSSIGDNKTVDLTFTTQIGGPEQADIGVFISGFENPKGADLKHKSFPTISSGKYYEYGEIGTTGGFEEGRY